MPYVPEFLAKQFRAPKCSDFPGVLIPLEQAQRHHSVVAEAERRASVNASASAQEEGLAKPKVLDEKANEDPSGPRYSVTAYDVHTIEGLKAEIESDVAASGLNSAYDKKSKIMNKAIQDIGMGWYQWCLFTLCGFGWFADNFWLQGVAVVLTPIGYEFNVPESHTRFCTLSIFLGLCIGASFWGIASDVIGRRLAFNTTLFLAAVFGIAAGAAPSFVGICALLACIGIGVGGNLPVDGALFLEFLPFASGNLLTLLSVWWPVGAVLSSLIAWGFLPNYSCSSQVGCQKDQNPGWRYVLYTLGAITFLQWFARFFLFQMFESPKFLLSRGRQAEAVAVIHGLAYKNGKKTWLTEEILNEVVGTTEDVVDTKLSTGEIVKRSLSKFSTERIGPLFSSWQLGVTTGLLWFQWATIGMGYPLFNAFLPQYIRNTGGSTVNSNYITYRNYAITTACGVPGSLIAAWTVNIKYIGRKGTMAFATVVTGVFVYLFTASSDANFQLIFTCLESFFQNVMYGVLYAYTPEVFPAPNRGTGTGTSSFLNRVAGLCAPIVAIYANPGQPKSPIYASGALFLAASISMLALPIETRGKQSL